MNAGYKDYLQKGTLKILNKDSSLDINEEERTAIITAFADELTKNIGDTTKLKDCDLLVYSTLLSLTDEKLSSLLSDSNVSDDELVTGIALCEKIRKYLKVFADNNWTLPEIENSDPSKSASTIRKIQQTRLMRGRILEKDKQINDLIIRARKELSTKACDDVIELANKLNEDLDICKQKRIGIPQIENGDLKKLTAKVEEIRIVAEQKESTFREIYGIDKKMDTIITTNALSLEEIQRLVSLCTDQNSLFAECKRRSWPIPKVKYINPEAISMQYRHYSVMLTLDQTLVQQKESLSSKKQYEAFYKNCELQQENIITCIRNKWRIPVLTNRDPEELKNRIQKEQIEEEKRRKSWRNFTFAIVLSLAVIISGLVCFHNYRSGMAEIPFDATYVSGQELNEVYDELQSSGFINIKTKPTDSGWLEGNTVVSVTIDNSNDYSKGSLKDPDVNVIINFSSSERVYVTELLKDWKTTKYLEIERILKEAGFNNITVNSVDTNDKAKDKLIAEIQLNGEEFLNENCYIPKSAPIKITFHFLKIGIGNDSSQFIGQDYRDVVAGFEESGFTNVQTQEVTTGWVEGNKVVGVTVNNVDTYDSSQTFEPDVKIVVKYSSDNRVNITDVLNNWQKTNYEVLNKKLAGRGFSNIKLEPKETETKSQNLLVSSLWLNNDEFIAGDCYLQKTAKVVIEYYVLHIKIGQTAKKFKNDKQYDEVVKQLKEKGFTNIRLMRANNLYTGFITHEGTIKKITINGADDFNATDVFRYDSEIVIIVNTKKGSGCDDITEIAP